MADIRQDGITDLDKHGLNIFIKIHSVDTFFQDSYFYLVKHSGFLWIHPSGPLFFLRYLFLYPFAQIRQVGYFLLLSVALVSMYPLSVKLSKPSFLISLKFQLLLSDCYQQSF